MLLRGSSKSWPKGEGRARQEGTDLQADAALQRGGRAEPCVLISWPQLLPSPSERWREGLARFLYLFIFTLCSLSMEI